MYELVKRILDKSKETGDDVLTAYDKVAAEIGRSDELKEAKELINKHYDVITKCRREKDEEAIKKLCDVVANGTPADIRAYKEEIMER